MKETIRLGKIGGVAVGAHWSVLAIVALVTWSLASVTLPDAAPGHPVALYWMGGLVAALALVVSILAHELTHAAVARHHGVGVEGITLWMFGGVARLTSNARDATAELHIALAGPAMSAGIAAVAGAAAGLGVLVGASRLVIAGLAWLGLVNGVLAVFNLLPGAPLDGGRVLAAILWRRSGDERAARVSAARAGRVVGQWLVALGVVEVLLGAGISGIWMACIGWFLTAAARAEEADVGTRWLLGDVRVHDVMSPNPATVAADELVTDFVHGEALTMHWSSYPVTDADGRPVGLVTLRRIRTLPREAWATTRLGQVAVPMDRLAVVGPDDVLLDALAHPAEGDGRLLVVVDGRLVGIVSPTDVTRALERYGLARGGPAR